jgi:FkbM family methyltransferase
MTFNSFIFRQRSKWKYHTAKTEIEKTIAEINRLEPQVQERENCYYIPAASLLLPKGVVDHIFIRFDLFLQNMRYLEGKYVWDNEKLFFLFDDFKTRIVSANELVIINEIFFHRCYNFKLPQNQLYNVIDVGMNVGLASLYFAGAANVKRVFSFEPFPKSFQDAQENFSNNINVSGKIKPFNFGLGKSEKTMKALFNPMASGTSRSVGLQSSIINSGLQEEAIQIKDAYEVINGIICSNEDVPYIMKLDCEGAEYEIMDSLFEKGLPERIISILMEWHGSMPETFESNILNNGFQFVSTRLQKNTGLLYAFR